MPKSRKRKLNRDFSAETEPSDGRSPDERTAVRPGTFNLNGDLFSPEGELVRRTKAQATPSEARKLVLLGARVAYEGCGCGGGGGCTPSWLDREDAAKAAAATKPQFTGEYGSPTWIDVWKGDADTVVFLHGDVRWGILVDED